MKLFNRHTLMLLVGIVLSNVGVMGGSLLLLVWGKFGLLLVSAVIPFTFLVMVSIFTLPKDTLARLFTVNEEERTEEEEVKEEELKHHIGLIVGASVISTILGAGILYVVVKGMSGVDTISGFNAVIIILSAYIVPYTAVLGKTSTNGVESDNKIIELYIYICTVFTSVLGIGLMSSFYTSTILLGLLFVFISIVFSDMLDKVHTGKVTPYPNEEDKKQLTK